jgi:cytochrome b
MSTTSESRADAPADAPAAAGPARKVLVWDAPVRVFHWLMVFSFAGAYLTAESERWRLLHVSLGYTMAGLVAFRIVWGLIGTRHARFSDFVRGPAAIARYVGGMLRGEPKRHVGHNPLGALAIVALLGLTLAIAASGWAVFNEAGGEWLEGAHEFAANTMLAVVGIHIAGVLLASKFDRENLIGAMFTGRKVGRPEDGVRSAWRSVAMLMLVAVLGFWWFQWQAPPVGAGIADQAGAPRASHNYRDSD